MRGWVKGECEEEGGLVASQFAASLSCDQCSYVCFTSASLKSHKMRMHSYRHPARALVTDAVCPACMTDFWVRPRLLFHLKKNSSKCLEVLSAWRKPFPQEELDRADAQDEVLRKLRKSQGRPYLWAEFPAFKRVGPLASSAPFVPQENHESHEDSVCFDPDLGLDDSEVCLECG